MADRPDVIVVGAGIIGCAITHELARRGAAVRVFEARAIGAGATQASAGVLAPYIESPRPGPLHDLCVRSLSAYDAFVAAVREDSGVAVEYRACGTLEVATDADLAERLRAERRGPGEWLDAAAVRAVEPALPESAQGGVLVREHAYVAAPRLTEALTWAALKHGADFEAGRPIVAVEPRGAHVEVRAADGTAWQAAHVVVAAGSWSSRIGLDQPAARAVRPVRGQLLRLAWPNDAPRHVIWGPSCYVVPWTDGSVLVGATVEDVGFDERTTAAGVRDLLDAACELLPGAWGATFVEARAGLRPASADGLPIIGRSAAMPGLVYATGHYRNGILLAPITATLVADLVMDGKADPILKAFDPARFAATPADTP